MKELLYNLLKKGLISRRDFLKYLGVLGGASVVGGRALKGTPSKVLAQLRPRVVSIRNADATNWNYSTGYYWEYINQDVVNNMVAKGVMALTNTSSAIDAWKALISYQVGEAVVIKVNFNNASGCEGGYNNNIDACSETVNAVIDGLLSIGIPADKILIADPSRVVPNRFIDRIHNAGVRYFSAYEWNTCNKFTDYVAADSPAASPTTHPTGDVVRPAQIFVDAAHLINIPLLKGHGMGHTTLGMKNHYGSVTFKNYPASSAEDERMRMHAFLEPELNSDPEKNILADICNNQHIKGKTRLILGDGLFGNPVSNWQSVARWQIFGNDDPNILFFGIDPIAIDSVMCDYISAEQGGVVYHSELHHGAALGLGVHDQWDSLTTKRYSLIDYVYIEGDNKRTIIDQKIRQFKEGQVSRSDVLNAIDDYMQGD